MKGEAYEKNVFGKHLNHIFNFDKLNEVEIYFVHVENIGGSRNNYIQNTNSNVTEVKDLYVSEDDMTSLKMV